MTVYLHCEGETDRAVIRPLMRKVSGDPDLDIKRIKKDELKLKS